MTVATRESDKFLIRLPEGLRGRIKASARDNVRSMNSEIIFHLEQIFSDQPETKKADARS